MLGLLPLKKQMRSLIYSTQYLHSGSAALSTVIENRILRRPSSTNGWFKSRFLRLKEPYCNGAKEPTDRVSCPPPLPAPSRTPRQCFMFPGSVRGIRSPMIAQPNVWVTYSLAAEVIQIVTRGIFDGVQTRFEQNVERSTLVLIWTTVQPVVKARW